MSTAPRRWAALAGVVAAAVALGFSELMAGLAAGIPSLVYAVGAAVVDSVPGWVERHAIAILGTADKPALVTGVVVLTALAGAGLGVVALRSRWQAAVGLAAFAVIGAVTGATYRDSDPAAAAATAVATAVAAMATLTLLLRRMPPRAEDASAVDGTDGDIRRPNGTHDREHATGHGRRAFLKMAGTAVVVAGAAAVTGRWLTDRTTAVAARIATMLPTVQDPVTIPSGADLEIAGLTPYIVPNADFYRIDTALRVPVVDPATWQLSVEGAVDHPFTLTYDDLLALPQTEQIITLTCVSNEVGEELVGNAVWQGVRLRDLLDRAGVQPAGTQIVGRSVDGFTAGFPTQVAMEIPDALVAVGMNGEPLPLEHGYPARLVVPGLYGYVSATKWLAQILLTDFEDFDAYWITRGWAKEGVIKTQSRIDVPRPGATVPAGEAVIAGVAWAPARGITAVQVQVDDGAWQAATLATRVDIDTWRQWFVEWDATSGRHTIAVRAADATEQFQTAEVTPVYPSGATGHHTIEVLVA